MSEFDFVGSLRALTDLGVRFVLIGGLAGRVLGSPMITNDVDICYDRRPDNLELLASALVAMHARLRGVGDEVPFILDARTLAAGDCFTFVTDYGSVDILGTPRGSAGYDDLRARARMFDVGGIRLWVASLDDLMEMKRAAGRITDLYALEILGGLRDELEGRPERN